MGGAWGPTVPDPSEGNFDPVPETRDKRENTEIKALRRKDTSHRKASSCKDTRTDTGQQMERDHRDGAEGGTTNSSEFKGRTERSAGSKQTGFQKSANQDSS